MGLTDLTLGYDPVSANNIAGAIPMMENYSREVSTLSGAEPEERAGLNAYHLNPQVAMKSKDQIVEIVTRLVRRIQSKDD